MTALNACIFNMRRGVPLVLNVRQLAKLQEMAKSARTKEIAKRAKIILLCAQPLSNAEVAARAGVSRPTVIFWRQKYQKKGLASLKKVAHRRGRPASISRQAKRKIAAAANTGFESEGKLQSSRAVAAGQPGTISHMTVRRIWCKRNLRLPQAAYPDVSKNRPFLRTLRDVFGIYLKPPDFALAMVATKPCHDEDLRQTLLNQNGGLLNPNDLFNARTFFNRLSGSKPLDKYLREECKNADFWPRKECQNNSESEQRERLVSLLNRVMQTQSLHDFDSLARWELARKTRLRPNQKMSQSQLVYWNRRLLVDTYPSEFPEYFDCPSSQRKREHWTKDLFEFITEVEPNIHHPSILEEMDDEFTEFLKEVYRVADDDVDLYGDLWRLPEAQEFGIFRELLRYHGMHELHIIASGSLTRKGGVVEEWIKAHKNIHMHFLSPQGKWINGLARFFRQIRLMNFSKEMFVRANDFWEEDWENKQGIEFPTPQLALTNWWPRYDWD